MGECFTFKDITPLRGHSKKVFTPPFTGAAAFRILGGITPSRYTNSLSLLGMRSGRAERSFSMTERTAADEAGDLLYGSVLWLSSSDNNSICEMMLHRDLYYI